MRTWSVKAIAVAVSVTLTGCSFLTMERVMASDRDQLMPTCTQSVKPVIADGLGVIFFSSVAAYDVKGALDDSSTEGDRRDHIYGVLAGVGIIAIHVASGLWGYRAQERCRVARHAHEVRIRALSPETNP
jgi:hypothetical protein